MLNQPSHGLSSINSNDIRSRLVDALRLDLVGPWPGHPLADEKLPGWKRPSSWYLTGFLIPSGTPPEQMADPDENEDLSEVLDDTGLAEENTDEGRTAKKGIFPSSMGLSFLAASDCRRIELTVCWGDYELVSPAEGDDPASYLWHRIPREEKLILPLQDDGRPAVFDVPHSSGLQIHAVLRSITDRELTGHIPEGTRSVSVFLVNHRRPFAEAPDRAFVFQPELRIQSAIPLVPRPDMRGTRSTDWDELVADVHFADTPSFATGHGVSADWDITDGVCRSVRTIWIPSAEVEKTVNQSIPGLETSMDILGALGEADAVTRALMPMVEAYRRWIFDQESKLKPWTAMRLDTAKQLLHQAGLAAGRMERGISILASDAGVRDAFCLANRSVSRALKQRLKIGNPTWHAFQLAFILLNLPGMADPADFHRDSVDLLYFPTGGGKTEAYLGLAAFAMALRRIRHPGDQGRSGAGVSVIMRYTLRLLTLDQLGRAAGLVCAMELEREKNPDRFGSWPFEIGLWVGKAATPNRMGRKGGDRGETARSRVRQYKADPRYKPCPIPIETCPWCGTKFTPESFSLKPNDDYPRDLRIVCSNYQCDFTRDRPLPIVAVDDPIYHRLPAFLIATLDKFASLPWIGPSGMLLGGAERNDRDGFYGSADPGVGDRLSKPLPPPDLIIQDELHLISGPLGTMAGLYESAIEALCIRRIGEREIRPKIIASTATVRKAQQQIQALFARQQTQIFPPPGPDRRDSFFARTVSSSEVNARLYIGVAPQGRNPKEVMRRVWLTLLGAAEKAYRDSGGAGNRSNPADPYMTVLGYFNSLRELGGARRVIEEQIQNTIRNYGIHKRVGEKTGLFHDRRTMSDVMELTSRIPTGLVSEARRRLELFSHESERVDYAIATNMISVGLDIRRLGLMVVNGQPKTHSEYIQATSRVGRDDQRPGLVVTLLNFHKPRDRSHYEQFRYYHETFYRSVEAASVTPFSARALDRGLPGALVTMVRHMNPRMTPPGGAGCISDTKLLIENPLLETFIRRMEDQPIEDARERDERKRSVRNRILDLLDSWLKIAGESRKVNAEIHYQKHEMDHLPVLLREPLEDEPDPHCRKFRVNRSLRDVEPEVDLYLRDLSGKYVEDAS